MKCRQKIKILFLYPSSTQSTERSRQEKGPSVTGTTLVVSTECNDTEGVTKSAPLRWAQTDQEDATNKGERASPYSNQHWGRQVPYREFQLLQHGQRTQVKNLSEVMPFAVIIIHERKTPPFYSIQQKHNSDFLFLPIYPTPTDPTFTLRIADFLEFANLFAKHNAADILGLADNLWSLPHVIWFCLFIILLRM